jgi:AraC-like DNA-binding protein
MTVEEVSEHTGFSSIYYFSRIFRERIGTSPTAWITNNGKDI